MVNLLGFFAPLIDDCELYDYLKAIGVRTIHEISREPDLQSFYTMAEANFNLVLHPEARMAASDLEERLRIPSIELTRLYQIDKIHSQYRALGQVLGVSFEDHEDYQRAKAAIDAFHAAHPNAVFSIGECMNGDPFELALALTGYGFRVAEVFGTLQGENFGYLKRLAAVSPDTRVYSNMEPTMLYYDPSDCPVTVSVGKDAGYYHPESPALHWNSDVQPYGYAGLRHFMEALLEVLR